MIRPLPINLQIYGRQPNLAGLGTAVTGLAVMFYSFWKLELSFPFWKVILFLVSLVLGAVIRVNINFASSLLSVWIKGAGGLKGTIYDMQELAKYPLDIYPRAFRVLLLSLMPFAAISYVPATVILGRTAPVYFVILPAATVLIIGIRKFIYYKAMGNYEGSGS